MVAPKIGFRDDGAIKAYATRQGWILDNGRVSAAKIAEAIGMHRATVACILSGKYPVTHGFVGRILANDPDARFADLFVICAGEDDEDERVAS